MKLSDAITPERQRDALLLMELIAQGASELKAGDGIPHDEVAASVWQQLAEPADDD